MANRPSAFKQADLVRALKAAQVAGLPVVGYEITADGRIIVRTVEAADSVSNDWDAK